MTMQRAMCIWLPNLLLDAMRRSERRSGGSPERGPVLLVRTENRRRLVAFCCARAAAAGVRPGMPASEAMAILPPGGEAAAGVRVVPARPERDGAVLRALAVWAGRFSPNVAIDPPDGLMLDVRGCARAFGGEGKLLRGACRGLTKLGFGVRAAIAPTFGCAWAVSRFGNLAACRGGAIVNAGEERAAMGHLPVRGLRIEESTRAGLAELGVERIGEVLALSRRALPARFAPDLLLRIDQALGSAMETIVPVRAIAPPSVERLFDGPTTCAEAIGQCTHGLIERLCAELTGRESGARRVEIVLDRSDLEPARLTISVSRPTRDPRHLWRLVRPRLERVHLGYGVERIALMASWVARLRHEQAERWREDEEGGSGGGGDTAANRRAADELIDTLVNRLGAQRVRRIEPVESHVPERAFCFRAALDGRPARAQHDDHTSPRRSRGDRPSVVFPQPVPARVVRLAPDGPAMCIVWDGCEVRLGPDAQGASAAGERIAAEWWRDSSPTRDYFRAADDRGRVLWLMREVETGRWFVHGVWA